MKSKILSTVLGIATGAILGSSFIAIAATQYGSGSLLQIGDVHSSQILNGTILNEDINAFARIDLSKLYAGTTHGNIFIDSYGKLATTSVIVIATTSPSVSITAPISLPATTTINGVGYIWPKVHGASGKYLSDDGTGVLSFVSLGNVNYGDGADGALDITTGTTTLTRDMYYTSLTLASSTALETNGYKIYVSGVLTNRGIIENNGISGSAGVGSISNAAGVGGVGGVGGAGGTLNGGVSGGSGGYGGTTFNAGNPGNAGTALNPCAGVSGAGGGAGGVGNYSGGAGGAGGICTSENLVFLDSSYSPPAVVVSTATSSLSKTYQMQGSSSGTYLSTSAGAGGGGGGGSNASTNSGAGGGGGGGGGSAGIVYIEAATIANYNIIQALGGAGGAGGSNTLYGGGQPTGGGGGGAGGAGGVITFIYTTMSVYGTISVAGGSGGVAGVGYGSTSAVAGTTGTMGKIYKVNI